jgi:methyl-accepting chemotaxis protein
MRVGIVCNNDSDLELLLSQMVGQHVAWAAGSGLSGGHRCYVYPHYTQAMDESPVDLIIDSSGEVQVREAMVVEFEAARFLLSASGQHHTDSGSQRSGVLTATSGELNSNLDKVLEQIELMERYSRQLSEAGVLLDASSQGILEAVDRTGRILDSITRIAKRSKIIGLNSAIEAARVGEQGRGFAVVAEEIKTLADDSSHSVKEIEKILAGIQRRSGEFAQRIGVVQDVSDMQQQATGQVTALLQAMKELGDHLRQLSNEAS